MNELIAIEKIAQWEKLKQLVLDSVSSPITKRVYNMALNEFMKWFQQAPRPGFTKATVSAWRVSLEERGLGSSSIIIRMSAIRKLAAEAADNGSLAPRRSHQSLWFPPIASKFSKKSAASTNLRKRRHMLGHGAKFEQKMQQAIAALLSHRSVEQAANEVGISATTLQRWMKEPEFQAELRKARRAAYSHAIGRLHDAAGAATSTLLRIMTDLNTPAATRLRAIEIVLEQGAKAATINDLDDRVTKLERNAHSAEITWLSSKPLPDAAPSRARIEAPGGSAREVDAEAIE